MSYSMEFYKKKFVVPVDEIVSAYDTEMETESRSPWSYPSLPHTILEKMKAPVKPNEVVVKSPFAGKWPTRCIFFDRLKHGPVVHYFGKVTYRPLGSDKIRTWGRDVIRLEFDRETLVNVWCVSRGGTGVSNLHYSYYMGSSGWTSNYHQPIMVTREPYNVIYQRAR